jgi:hypothetical protein
MTSCTDRGGRGLESPSLAKGRRILDIRIDVLAEPEWAGSERRHVREYLMTDAIEVVVIALVIERIWDIKREETFSSSQSIYPSTILWVLHVLKGWPPFDEWMFAGGVSRQEAHRGKAGSRGNNENQYERITPM